MAEPSTTKEKKETVIETVKMDDGRLVDFPGKKRLQKESYIAADGSVTVRFDFRNGRSLSLELRTDMIPKYAAHGAEQKVGDETAGVEDIEDAVLAVEELLGRLDNGEWTVKREAGGMSGTSVLLRAIVEVTGKSVEAIKQYLSTKTQAQKMALRDSAKFREAVARIEAEKAAKKPKVEISEAEWAELDAIPG